MNAEVAGGEMRLCDNFSFSSNIEYSWPARRHQTPSKSHFSCLSAIYPRQEYNKLKQSSTDEAREDGRYRKRKRGSERGRERGRKTRSDSARKDKGGRDIKPLESVIASVCLVGLTVYRLLLLRLSCGNKSNYCEYTKEC